MKHISLQEVLLEDVEGVVDLDKIGGDGRDRQYLVYLPKLRDPSNPELPLCFGTDVVDLNSTNKCQALVENMLMRINETMTVPEAKELAEKEQYDLVIEDLHTGLIYDYQYIILQ